MSLLSQGSSDRILNHCFNSVIIILITLTDVKIVLISDRYQSGDPYKLKSFKNCFKYNEYYLSSHDSVI